MAEDLSVAKWREERRRNPELRVLLVVDPTKDLPGARKEGEEVQKLLEATPAVHVDRLFQGEASRNELRTRFHSGSYDVLHYAGHAFFEPDRPERSGILCARGEVLSGAELAGLSALPSMVFFNACESARVRKREARKKGKNKPRVDTAPHEVHNVGLAEAFLRGGVANYLGTYWPVGDAAAKVFSATFYREILQGRALGAAIAAGRAAVRKQGSVDWADYIHYGAAEFVLKVKDD
jgi:CHAT domain-containing protein